MKYSFFVIKLSIILGCINLNFQQILYSQEVQIARKVFECKEMNAKILTVYNSTEGTIPIILWNYKKSYGFGTPKERCEKSSINLNKSYKNGTYKYMRGGNCSGKPAIYISAVKGGKCIQSSIVLMLKPGTDTDIALSRLLMIGKLMKDDPFHQGNNLLFYYNHEPHVNFERLIDIHLDKRN